MLEACYYDPADFFRAFLRFEYLYTWQRRVCEQMTDAIWSGAKHLKVLCRTAHGAGKTAFVAGLVQNFIYTRPQPKALTLAQSWEGVEDLIWAAINRQWKHSLMADLSWGRCLTTRLEIGPDEFAVGSSSDKPAKLEGKHGLAAMRVIDEAKGVEEEVFEATDGLLSAPETWDIWISTPSIPDGQFYRRDMGNDTSVIRAFATVEDLIQDYKQFGYPTLAGMEAWRDEKLRDWGENDSRYRSRCMAEYIDNVEGALFPASWIERACSTDFGKDMKPVVTMVGMDVAGSDDGDENAVAAVERFEDGRVRVLGLKSWFERDTMRSKERAQAFARMYSAPLRVDSIGIGKGVLDQSRADKFETEEFRASDKPRKDEDRYVNRKAQESWLLRERLEKGQCDFSRLPHEMRQRLKAQMVGMRYEERGGKVRVVDPTDSPDLFDAILIGAARRRPGIVGLHHIPMAGR